MRPPLSYGSNSVVAQSDWAKDAGHDPPGFHAPILHPPAKRVNAFTHWREILNFAPIAQALRQSYTNAIEAYLDYCRRNGLSVAVGTARDFMADATRRGLAKDAASWKKGLNWFITTGRKTSGPLPPGVPSLGYADTGQTDWERRLIERLRLNQYSWRTVQPSMFDLHAVRGVQRSASFQLPHRHPPLFILHSALCTPHFPAPAARSFLFILPQSALRAGPSAPSC